MSFRWGRKNSFKLQHREKSPADALPEILFYGSFINLQAPEVIVEAARQVVGARWTLLGSGPLRRLCERKSRDCEHIRYEEWLPYRELPERIGRADLLLGIFGSTEKQAGLFRTRSTSPSPAVGP